MTNTGLGGEEIKEESSWRYPLAIFLATLILCAVFLYYYVGPSMDELGGNVPSPAISEEKIQLKVADVTWSIPANFTVYPRDRRGGQRDEVYLYALWSTFSGYTPARRAEFVEDDPESRRLDITIAERTTAFDEAGRIDKLYLPQTIDKRGLATPLRLVRFEFREQPANVPTNGYSDTELYLGEDDDGAQIAIFCVKERSEIKSPYCWREYEFTNNVSVIYRFKKPYLPEWKNIDRQVRDFVAGLQAS